MLAPRSYTREDVVELQCHGGAVCVRRILQACLDAGARLAQPGEFTLRAFLNGRLDLAQAEGVAQLVAAQTFEAADSALASIQGGLSAALCSMREECIDLLVEVEARLDFDDELPPLDPSQLAGRSERAIVTDIAGTTRDVVEARVVIGGVPARLLDTAGIRATFDQVERMGVERSEAAALGADVVVVVVSATDGWLEEDGDIVRRILGLPPTSVEDHRGRRAGRAGSGTRNSLATLAGPMAITETQEEVYVAPAVARGPAILLVNKTDAAPAAGAAPPAELVGCFDRIIATSAHTREGFAELEAAVLALVGAGSSAAEGQQWVVNQRQAEQLTRANEALERLAGSIDDNLPVDFWTVDLRGAALALGSAAGGADSVPEEVLSAIFSRFCIGK
eukprot:SM000035S13112  [mRNA]  locus=s35:492809:496710:+ [translate_table: standard]